MEALFVTVGLQRCELVVFVLSYVGSCIVHICILFCLIFAQSEVFFAGFVYIWMLLKGPPFFDTS